MGPRCEEGPLNAVPAGHSAGLRDLADVLTDMARRVSALDRLIDRALRERTRAVALMYPRRRAAARARSRLRAIGRVHDRVYDLGVEITGDLIVRLAAVSFHIDNLGRALCWVPSYESPHDRSEIRSSLRLLAREVGIDFGLDSRVDPDAIRKQKHDLAEAVERARAHVEMLLSGAQPADDRGGRVEPENGA